MISLQRNRDRVSAQNGFQVKKTNIDHVDIIIALSMASLELRGELIEPYGVNKALCRDKSCKYGSCFIKSLEEPLAQIAKGFSVQSVLQI